MKNKSLKGYLVLVLLFSLMIVPASTAADFPSKAIQVINPFGAGGSTDMTCRALAGVAPEFFGQPMVVVTKGGAGGSIGAAYVANSRPDGYTLIMGSMATIVMRSLLEKLPYTLDSFIPIGKLVNFKGAILVQGSAPWNSIEDLINDAKTKELKYGSAGVGTTGHISVEALAMAVPEGMKLIHVPYEGSGPSQAALLGGHVDFILGDPSVAVELIKAGQLKSLAVVSSTRSSALPDVPTLLESGYNVSLDVWRALFAPKGTPDEAVKKLRESLAAAAASKPFINMINKLGQEYDFKDGEAFNEEAQQSKELVRKIMEKQGLLAK